MGLPVYNGEKYLEGSLRSLLSQTLKDFELIISDNSSSDRTYEICRDFASRDNRIKLYRNDYNIGVARNHNRTFHLSQGKYFRWAAHDDICAPTLLEKCVKVLEQTADVILCYFWIIRVFESDNTSTEAVKPTEGTESLLWERFRSLSDHQHACEQVYGLIRSDVLRSIRLQKDYTDSDRTMLSELSLHGKFYVIQEPLFYKRFHSENDYRDRSAKMVMFGESYRGKVVFPYLLQFFDYLEMLNRVRLPLLEKLKCYWVMMGWPFRAHRRLAKELLIAVRTLIERLATTCA